MTQNQAMATGPYYRFNGNKPPAKSNGHFLFREYWYFMLETQ